MKKSFKLFAMAFALLFAITIKVDAAGVTDVDSLNACINSTETICNVTSTIYIKDGAEVTIDLAGKELKGADTISEMFKIENGSLTIKNGKVTAINDAFWVQGNSSAGGEAIPSELVIEASAEVYSEKSNCIYIRGNGAKADVYGKLVSNSAEYAAIQGNGLKKGTTDHGNTEINIYDGASVISNNNHAIYHPQSGVLTVYGGTIEGVTGIEMRSGNLYVYGGTITATASSLTVNKNSNGSTVTGAGIALAQHTTLQDAFVGIAGGTIKGVTALYEVTPENPDNKDVVEMEILGGTFESTTGGVAVYSENKTDFIAGGTYNTPVEDDYVLDSAKTETNQNGVVTIRSIYEIYVSDGIKNGTITVQEEAYEGDLIKITAKADKGYKLSKITVYDIFDNELTVTNNSFTMPLGPVYIEVTFVKEEAVPNTSDSVMTYVVAGIISMMVLGFTVKARKA